MIHLLLIEVHRSLARRLVRVLLVLAVVVVGLVAVLVFAANEPLPEGSGRFAATDDPRFLVSLWPQGAEAQGLLVFAAVVVPVVAFVAGASMIGAEWRAGTVATQLTWEPRRVLLLESKLLANALVATVIGAVVTALFAAAFLPTVLANGSTAGADAGWWSNVLGGWLRISALTGITAAFGAALAAIGRNSAGAIGVGLAWISFGEGLVRALLPAWRRWLVGENAADFLTGGGASVDVAVSTTTAGLRLLAYAIAACAVALALFHRRDVAETS